LVFTSYILYIIIAAFIFKITNTVFIKTFFVPLCTFVTVSVFRKVVNFQRPYEKMKITPLIHKDKKGHSFPSRHVASAFIIAMSFLYVNIPLGIVYLTISVLIAITRVLVGVHFVKDVVAGAVFSLVIGLIFLFII
jgi:membrane-associated phospholipid phosphatase